ncbi:XrtA system polysaccharide chain length determinant [Thalassotalea agarivorans]|uniref:Polysaccharide chain length determinant protein, PEP-CTERM locus subfamily n=1 Tax=Thalassotalea agarivorans TaxID=349064 RepID=A0A1I0DZ02_THASX|nr:XrtA system polysaccharide chain length determinant [Thalassotalea agarivorans]SET37280.1 polysaccharide chain length determinant protein, PEP-CTERM locus subfamily [Thalassotalea agarivorans]
MQELIQQLVDYSKGLWIKRRYIIIATWLICPIGWAFIANLDDVYESEARIYVDTQSILGPLLKGITVQTDTDSQIRLMIRTLKSRPNLERIARMTDLDIQTTSEQQFDQLIDDLKDDIEIQKVGGRNENIFTVTYRHKDPDIAKNVVQSALSVFIENTLGENRSDSDEAQKFLNAQIKEYEQRLVAAEARLTDFKQKNADVLPNQYGGYYDKLNIAKEQLKAINLNLRETESQLENAKAQLYAAPDEIKSGQSKIKHQNAIATTYDDRIAELEANLDALLLRYTDRHPDVKEVKRRLADLNRLRDQEIQAYLDVNSGGTDARSKLSQNPVIQSLQIQVNQLESQVASIRVRRDEYQGQVDDLEEKIHILPEIEAELTALNRGYEITKGKYEELLSRKETAQIAKQADQSTSKIEFRVIDPPRKPNKPAGPKRILFATGVLIFGFGTGIGLALLVSQINPVVTSAHQLTANTGIPVFGSVSATESLGLIKSHRRRTWGFVISNVLLFILLIGFLTVFSIPGLLS